ncbi:MAG: ParA family protein [Pirellulaceae bacterium]|nr:ParA family protein [Pirellulaceae bacterium]
MAHVLCVANQKGGVGKTTTAVNVAAGLAMAGHQTLLVDLDPQCNATSGLGCQPSLSHGLLSKKALRTNITNTSVHDLALLPGSRSFQDVEVLASGEPAASATIEEHLRSSTAAYEYVLIDCPPSVGPLTQTALSASSEVLMPIQCEYFAMEGLTQMIHAIRDVMQRPGSSLAFGGIVLTMHEPQLELTGEVESEVRDFFGEIVFDTVIPRDVTVSEAPSYGQPVLQYTPRSRGSWAYRELCLEVMDRE